MSSIEKDAPECPIHGGQSTPWPHGDLPSWYCETLPWGRHVWWPVEDEDTRVTSPRSTGGDVA